MRGIGEHLDGGDEAINTNPEVEQETVDAKEMSDRQRERRNDLPDGDDVSFDDEAENVLGDGDEGEYSGVMDASDGDDGSFSDGVENDIDGGNVDGDSSLEDTSGLGDGDTDEARAVSDEGESSVDSFRDENEDRFSFLDYGDGDDDAFIDEDEKRFDFLDYGDEDDGIDSLNLEVLEDDSPDKRDEGDYDFLDYENADSNRQASDDIKPVVGYNDKNGIAKGDYFDSKLDARTRAVDDFYAYMNKKGLDSQFDHYEDAQWSGYMNKLQKEFMIDGMNYSQGCTLIKTDRSGQKSVRFNGTCGLASSQNALNLLSEHGGYTESGQVVYAASRKLCNVDDCRAEVRGGTTTDDLKSILDGTIRPEDGITTRVRQDMSVEDLAVCTKGENNAAIAAVESNRLWYDDPEAMYPNSELRPVTDHWVTVKEPVYDSNGELRGFQIIDSGGGEPPKQAYVDKNRFVAAYEGTESHPVRGRDTILLHRENYDYVE